MERDLSSRSPRDDMIRENELRRQLEEATPNLGFVAVMIAAVLVIGIGVFLFGSTDGSAPTQSPSPTAHPTSQ